MPANCFLLPFLWLLSPNPEQVMPPQRDGRPPLLQRHKVPDPCSRDTRHRAQAVAIAVLRQDRALGVVGAAVGFLEQPRWDSQDCGRPKITPGGAGEGGSFLGIPREISKNSKSLSIAQTRTARLGPEVGERALPPLSLFPLSLSPLISSSSLLLLLLHVSLSSSAHTLSLSPSLSLCIACTSFRHKHSPSSSAMSTSSPRLGHTYIDDLGLRSMCAVFSSLSLSVTQSLCLSVTHSFFSSLPLSSFPPLLIHCALSLSSILFYFLPGPVLTSLKEFTLLLSSSAPSYLSSNATLSCQICVDDEAHQSFINTAFPTHPPPRDNDHVLSRALARHSSTCLAV